MVFMPCRDSGACFYVESFFPHGISSDLQPVAVAAIIGKEF